MESPMMNVGMDQPKFKVSFTARLIAAFAYMIPALGGALSSLYLMNVLQAMRQAETAGMTAVMLGMAESTVPVLGSLYLGVFAGLVVIIVLIARMIMQTRTASPSGWFFVLCGFLFLVPAGLFLEAESMIIEVLTMPVSSEGVAAVGSNVASFLILSIISALFVFIALLVMSVIPFSARSKPRWSPLIWAVLVEILIIAAVIVFQWRYLWLSKAGMNE
jgi:hypothetical protein